MIFKWLNHDHFYNDEKLIAILSDLGMASFNQLQTITGWSKRTMQMRIDRVRSRANIPEDRNKWLTSFPNPYEKTRAKRNVVYALGLDGADYARTMKGELSPARTVPQSQVAHSVGINEILVRLLNGRANPKDIQWYGTNETLEMLLTWIDRAIRNPKEAEKARRECTRPDAMLMLQTAQSEEEYYWLEFDNNTESTRPLEKKFHRYFKTLELLEPLEIDFPVLWVTVNEVRRKYLASMYDDLIKHFYAHKKIPSMKFYVAGEETTFLLSKLSLTANNLSDVNSLSSPPPLIRRNTV